MTTNMNLDTVQLRSFLAVVEARNFTAAARRLSLGQSTVSQHVARLEEALGRILLLRSTKSVMPTADGAAMVEFAREIVVANDRALSYFDDATIRGRLRFGLSEDLVLSRLPDILRRFRLAYPLVDLDLTVGLSSLLYDRLGSGALDLVLAKRRIEDSKGVPLWRERMVWLGRAGAVIDPALPVPLVVYPGASITRKLAIDAMNAAGRNWHIAVSGDSLSALVAAVRVGFGVTAQAVSLTGALTTADLAILDETNGLPALPEVEFSVLGAGPLQGPALALADTIRRHAPLSAEPFSFTDGVNP